MRRGMFDSGTSHTQGNICSKERAVSVIDASRNPFSEVL